MSATALAPTTSYPTPAIDDGPPLRPIEKVAIVLSLLEPNAARQLATRFPEGAIERVIEAYENMRVVPKPQLLKTIASFVTDVRGRSPKVFGGAHAAQHFAEALGITGESADDTTTTEEETTDTSFGSLAPGADMEAVWTYLEQLEPERLARMISGERASVIAAVLLKLNDDRAGPIMAALPEPVAIAVGRQLAGGAPVSTATMTAITESLRRSAANTDDDDEPQEDSLVPKLTAILNRCPVGRQEAILIPLRQEVAEKASEVESSLIRFGRLEETLPRTIVPTLFREADEDLLHAAVRYGSENAADVVDFLYSNISQRLAEQIREQIDAKPLPSQEEGEAAQAALIALLLEWEGEGRFAFDRG